GGPVLDSGNAIQFSSDLALITRKKELWKEDDRTIGQKTFWNVTWSGIKAPGAEFITYNRFNEGVDHAMEQCELGIEMGLIGQSGAWFELEFLKDKLDDPEVVKFVEASGKSEDKAFKCQGKAAVYSLLKE